jgi:tRNA(Arg) A34 adenosine deaminase TadA
MIHPNSELMKICIEKAKNKFKSNQYAIGAMVVDEDGNIISLKNSNLITGYDPTAHPEIVAIRESAKKRKSRYLNNCYLYTTLEPCPMCTSAVIWAKMSGIVFGAFQEDALEIEHKNNSSLFTWRQINISSTEIALKGTPKIKIYGGILRDECKCLFNLGL